ncbi:MAG: zinc ribbon domain-containing protein [Gemmatimonadales bacterium]
MEIAIFFLLLIVGLTLIGYPLLVPRATTIHRAPPRLERRRRLFHEKEAVYTAIKDLEFEYKTGKLSDEDYAELCNGYRAKAFALLKEISEGEPSPGDGPLPCAQCGHVNPPASNFCEACGVAIPECGLCPSCEAAVEPGDRFCRSCGQPLPDERETVT